MTIKLMLVFLYVNALGALGENEDDELLDVKDPNEICETPVCKVAATKLLEDMDLGVEPCDDFYKFTCGKYIEKTVLPPDVKSINEFTRLRKLLQNQLIEIFKSDAVETGPQAFKLLKSYYQSCVNTTQIDATSENDLREILNEFGGWPILDGQPWNESTLDWKNIVYKTSRMGFSVSDLAGIFFVLDENSGKLLIRVSHPIVEPVGLDRWPNVKEAFLKYLLDIAEILGANRNNSEEVLRKSMEVRTELAKISNLWKHNQNSDMFQTMTLRDLENRYPIIPWLEYLNKMLEPNHSLGPDDEIMVDTSGYFEALPELLSNTSKLTLANYLLSNIVVESIPMLSERIRKLTYSKIPPIFGRIKEKPRWEMCLNSVTRTFTIAVGAIYARSHSNEIIKQQALQITEDIRSSFRQIINEEDWMDEETKIKAIEKLDAILLKVAYPDELLDDQKVNACYQDLKIHSDSYLKNYLNINLFKKKEAITNLQKEFDQEGWIAESRIVKDNAYFDVQRNKMTIPAGILQDKFFENGRPNYMNYATIGTVIGHEMTHAFDDDGSKYDKEGNFSDWWDPMTKQKFSERSKCLIDQYSNYTVGIDNLHMNGMKTLDENIADNGGLKGAYLAYNKWIKENGREPSLPGLSYTQRQMFWISYANMWCSKYKEEALKKFIRSDRHSFEEFRIIGTLANIPEFSKDFNCRLGTKMNPEKKCTVW